ncbi:MAG: hypothetical protein IJ743_00230 [Bacilli bacterium]|nr:hypothetical protein [Bacilli bacterium]
MNTEICQKFSSKELQLITLFNHRVMKAKDVQDLIHSSYGKTVYYLQKNEHLLEKKRDHKSYLYRLKRDVLDSYLMSSSEAKEILSHYDSLFLKKLYHQSSSSMKTFLEHKNDDLFYCFSYYEILFIYYTLDIISKEQYLMYLGNFKFSIKHYQALFLKVMYFYHDVFSNLQILIVSSFCQQYLKDFQEFFSPSELKTLFFLLRYKQDGFDETIDLNDLLLKFIVFVEDVFMPRNQQNTLTRKEEL